MIKIDKLRDPKNIKILAIIIILFLISIISLNNSRALWSKNKQLKNEIIAKTGELTKIPNISPTKETIETQTKELIEKISSFEKRFSPDGEEIFSFLNRFAESAKISLKAISPLDKIEVTIPNSKDIMYLELPVNLKLECGYHQLVSFLNKVETAEKIMLVSEIKIQGNPQNIWDHSIELSLKVPMSISAKN